MGKRKKEDSARNKEYDQFDEQMNVEFGEMVPTKFGWIPPDEQKKKAEKHERL